MNAINGYNPRAPSRGNDDKHGQGKPERQWDFIGLQVLTL
jgi:hypothetical protein